VISEKTNVVEKKMLTTDYDDRLALYASHFCVYGTWLEEDTRPGLILVASMED
jgi:hypothetical protein